MLQGDRMQPPGDALSLAAALCLDTSREAHVWLPLLVPLCCAIQPTTRRPSLERERPRFRGQFGCTDAIPRRRCSGEEKMAFTMPAVHLALVCRAPELRDLLPVTHHGPLAPVLRPEHSHLSLCGRANKHVTKVRTNAQQRRLAVRGRRWQSRMLGQCCRHDWRASHRQTPWREHPTRGSPRKSGCGQPARPRPCRPPCRGGPSSPSWGAPGSETTWRTPWSQ